MLLARLIATLLLVSCAGLATAQLPPPTQCTSTALAGGTANALTVAQLPCGATTTLLILTLSATNTSTTVTLRVGSAAAQPVVSASGDALAVGALQSGATALLMNTGSQWRLISGLPAGYSQSFGLLYLAQNYGGCRWDGTEGEDVGPCINAAVTAVAAAGGGTILIPAGVYYFATQVSVTVSDIVLVGAGADSVATTGTELIWNGAAGSTMINFEAPYGAVSNKRIQNNGIARIKIDGADLAAKGLRMASLFKCRVDDVVVEQTTEIGMDFTVVPAIVGTSFGESTSMQQCEIVNPEVRAFAGTGIFMGTYVDATEGPQGNFSVNIIRTPLTIGSDDNTTGYICDGCDNNIIYQLRAFPSGGTSVELTITEAGDRSFPANANIFINSHHHGAFIARGQETFPGCLLWYDYTAPEGFCTIQNFVSIDVTNAAPNPTVETGADLQWTRSVGDVAHHRAFAQADVGPAYLGMSSTAVWKTCSAAAAANADTGMFYSCSNGANKNMTYDFGPGTSRFSVTTNAAGMTWTREAGTGNYTFSDGTVRLTLPTSCSGLVTGTLWNDAGTPSICP